MRSTISNIIILCCLTFFAYLLSTHTNTLLGQVEICDNGIDDDGDLLIDLNDEECECEIVEPVSLIPNPSFEDQDCCPHNRSQLNCADSWIQASEATTDYIHSCDWLGWDDFPPPLPFPDGNGIMGFRDGRVINGTAEPYWKEYAGACLLSPLLKDSVYKFQFDLGFVSTAKSPPINITFFGTSDCDNLPFGQGNDAFGCPTNSSSWVQLGQVNVSGNGGNVWVKTSIEIIPDRDIYAVAIGPGCEAVVTPISLYYFFDNLLLADIESFELGIAEIEHPCSDTYHLSVPNNPDFEYQWYKNGIALLGETFSAMSQIYGNGRYQVRIDNGTTCRLSTEFDYQIPQFSEPDKIAICRGDSFSFGDRMLTEEGSYIDTFSNEDGCDVIVELELSVIGASYDTLDVEILEGDRIEIAGSSFSEEGEYPLTLESSLGCDSLVLLRVSEFGIFFPNIFSPNDDGINDLFEPTAAIDIIDQIEFKIFDRWGDLVYVGQSWDGFYNGVLATPGVYLFIANITFTNRTSKTFTGDITLVR